MCGDITLHLIFDEFSIAPKANITKLCYYASNIFPNILLVIILSRPYKLICAFYPLFTNALPVRCSLLLMLGFVFSDGVLHLPFLHIETL